jgi:hypothetical protein
MKNILLVFAILVMVAVSCVPISDRGEEGKACFKNGTCLEGLVCDNERNICVKEELFDGGVKDVGHRDTGITDISGEEIRDYGVDIVDAAEDVEEVKDYGVDGGVDVEDVSMDIIKDIGDMTPPDTTITSYPPNPSNSTSATFEFTCNEGNCTFECQLDSGSWEICISPKTYTNLAAGLHKFSVRAKDSAGNVDSTPANYFWEIFIVQIKPRAGVDISYSNFYPIGSSKNVSDKNLKLKWSIPNVRLWNLTTGDINNDGKIEIVAMDTPNRHIKAFSYNGTLLWDIDISSKSTEFSIISGILLDDVTGDGVPKILAGYKDTTGNLKVDVFKGDSSYIKTLNAGKGGYYLCSIYG